MEHTRNFSIIAHIDHGKSTLADRMLELTGTVPSRKMREQVLDRMELERERGITIKMQPVRMEWRPTTDNQQQTTEEKNHRSSVVGHQSSNATYTLNLIDTPGHIDFAYEVSRALKAVEGTVLLVDATQGVQAQTLSTLHAALEQGLTIIPAVSKIDSPLARTGEVKVELATLLGVDPASVLEVSGKTGAGVAQLLEVIIERVPPPVSSGGPARALVFDFAYSDHQGVIIYTRVVDGSFAKGERLSLLGAEEEFTALEVGMFTPERVPVPELVAGTIGYIVTGVKQPGLAAVGDTVAVRDSAAQPLPGYRMPRPVVWASVYPEDADDFTTLRQSLERLRLTDASLSFEEEASGTLGRGFRCGFLGMLHLEIVAERLRREFALVLVVTTPSVAFEVLTRGGERRTVYVATQFPDHGELVEAYEPWVACSIITPGKYIGTLTRLLYEHEAVLGSSETFGERTRLSFELPLRELYRNVFDEVKSASSGFASLSYEVSGMREAHVTRMNVLIGGEVVPAFSRVVSRRRVEEEAEQIVERLEALLPRQQFATKIQAEALGRIVASRTLKAFRKDVTAKLYGGDVTRKHKLLEKQKKGKKKLRERSSVHIPPETFLKVMRLG